MVKLAWVYVRSEGEYVSSSGPYAYNISKMAAGSGTPYKWVTQVRPRFTVDENKDMLDEWENIGNYLTLSTAKAMSAYHATKVREGMIK